MNQFPIVGSVVVLNPEGQNFINYNGISNSDVGVVIKSPVYAMANEELAVLEENPRNIVVKWRNGRGRICGTNEVTVLPNIYVPIYSIRRSGIHYHYTNTGSRNDYVENMLRDDAEDIVRGVEYRSRFIESLQNDYGLAERYSIPSTIIDAKVFFERDLAVNNAFYNGEISSSSFRSQRTTLVNAITQYNRRTDRNTIRFDTILVGDVAVHEDTTEPEWFDFDEEVQQEPRPVETPVYEAPFIPEWLLNNEDAPRVAPFRAANPQPNRSIRLEVAPLSTEDMSDWLGRMADIGEVLSEEDFRTAEEIFNNRRPNVDVDFDAPF